MTNEIDKADNLSNENREDQNSGNDVSPNNEVASHETSESNEESTNTDAPVAAEISETTEETPAGDTETAEVPNAETTTEETPVPLQEESAQADAAEEASTEAEPVAEEAPAPEETAEATPAIEAHSSSEDEITETVPAASEGAPVSEETTPPVEASRDNTIEASPAALESASEESSAEEAATTATGEASEEEAEEEEEEPDYATLSKTELLEVASKLSRLDHFVKADNTLKVIAPLFNSIVTAERKEALDRFVADGGEAADFSYRDEEQIKFDGYYKIIKERKSKYFNSLEKQKEENYQKKLEILEKLREFVDSEENTTSINVLKALQEEYKAIGPIPGQHTQTLWANYHAIVDRFYDNRSIYFELKELDRKKNLKAKLALCEKAEALAKEEDFRKATAQLNELHEEFKHIGPIPRDHQELVWERFKAASDVVYSNRKSFLEKQKVVFEENLHKKIAVIEKVKVFSGFDSDRINDWNAKTKEILEVQKEWEAIGGIPRDKAKSVNKEFWGIFKGFFHDKGAFFKKLESFREENLQKKEELVTKAHEIKDSEDWAGTAETL